MRREAPHRLRTKRSSPLRERGQRGAIYVEYLFAGTMQLMLFSLSAQIFQIYVAKQSVDAAAFVAAKKAAAILNECPERFENEPRNLINYDGDPPQEDPLVRNLQAHNVLDGPLQLVPRRQGGPRLQEIRSAAYVRLLAAAPEPNDLGMRLSWWSAVGGVPEDRMEFGAAIYNRVASAVTFSRHEGKRHFTYMPDDEVWVRVTFMAPCTVPLVSWLMCSDWSSVQTQIPHVHIEELREAQASGDRVRIALAEGRLRTAQHRLQHDAEGWNALDYAEASWAGWNFSENARFMPLVGESQLLNNGDKSGTCTVPEGD